MVRLGTDPTRTWRRTTMTEPTSSGAPGPVAALVVELRQRWQQGERIRVEALLERRPEFAADAEVVLDLVYNEFLLREAAGEAPQLSEYRQRFPHLAEQLQIVFAVDRALAGPSAVPSTQPPSPADTGLGPAAVPAGGLPAIP